MRTVLSIFCLVVLVSATVHSQDGPFPSLSGPYLGQTPPGMKPERFAAGILSANDEIEINSVFSPAGNEFYYVVRQESSKRYELMFTKLIDGFWSKPKRLELAAEYSVADIALSADGERLYFCSEMPSSWDAAEGFDIWYVEREGEGWSTPVNAGKKINSPAGETQPSFTTDGSMVFPSARQGSKAGSVDIYYARYSNGEFLDPEPLSDKVNSQYNEGNSFIAPDGSYILFSRWGMPESIDGGKGLYISFRKPDGSWTLARNTKPIIDPYGSLAALSPNGQYLFYSGYSGIHWVDVRILEKLKPEGLR